MHEVDDELQEIKREIIESRSLVIKTNNLSNALSADIKLMARRQQASERRLRWNSAVAAVVFVAVVLLLLKFAVDARVESNDAKCKTAIDENTRLRELEGSMKKQASDKVDVETTATQFYDLIRQNRKADLVKRYDEVRAMPFTKTEQLVFADAVEKAKTELAERAYVLGQESAKLQRWQEAASRFEESLRYDDGSYIAPSVRLGLATAYRSLKHPEQAIPILTKLVEQNVDKEVIASALFLLAKCQTDLEAWNDAKATWKLFLQKYSGHTLALEAKRWLNELQAAH